MKKVIIILIVYILTSISFYVNADEGMWLLNLIERLNYADMQKMGLNLTAEEIYSVNHSSLKDAIVSLNDGQCSGTMISSEGLMMTCYHCAHPYIQKHTTIENDYLSNGFWAKNINEELKNDNLFVSFLVRIENVTQKIISQLKPEMTEEERATTINEISLKLKDEAIVGTHYNAKISSFYKGNEYYLFVYEIFEDVRLVGVPPTTIGLFGGETDNWTWPRYSADFALFRIYSSPSGEPAEYNKRNIPLKPKYYLPISIKGIKKDDFAMIIGYPGTTDRFMSSYGVKMTQELKNPAIIKIRTKKLELMKQDMDINEEVNIKYIPKYDGASNYWKYFIGQNEVLNKLNIYEKKKEIEDNFTKWINEDNGRKEKYGGVLDEISNAYNTMGKYVVALQYFTEAIMRGCEIFNYAYTFKELYNELKININNEDVQKIPKALSYQAKIYFNNYNIETDKKIVKALLKMYYEDVPKDQYPEILKIIEKKYKADFNLFTDKLFNKSIFSNKDNVLEFLRYPDYKVLDGDPAFSAMLSFLEKYNEPQKIYKDAELKLEKYNSLFVTGLMEMNKDKKNYPDANNTMRLTYGKITDYNPSKDVYHDYYTTIDGLIEKEKGNPKNPDFNIPDKLKELFETKNFGRYGKNGTINTCFITNNDITGGVSGAPVINSNGELIGIVFDINWEATSVSIAFNPELQRSISSDIRWILCIIDKYADATYLLKEMTIN